MKFKKLTAPVMIELCRSLWVPVILINLVLGWFWILRESWIALALNQVGLVAVALILWFVLNHKWDMNHYHINLNHVLPIMELAPKKFEGAWEKMPKRKWKTISKRHKVH